jgi:hypothetical protein
MSATLRSLLVVSAAACSPIACTVTDPLYCSEDVPCTDPSLPFCDLNGEYPASEGVARTCIPDPGDGGDGDDDGAMFECTADAFQRCDGSDTAVYCGSDGASEIEVSCESGCGDGGCRCEPDTTSCSDGVLTVCNADGVASETRNCALGCSEDGASCKQIEPSNGLGAFVDQAADAPSLVVPDGSTIDTDSGTIRNPDGATIEVTSGVASGDPEIRVFPVRSLELGNVEINGDLPAAFVANGDVTVTGHVRVRAGSSSGACEGQDGGGGAFGTRGGDGDVGGSDEGGAGGMIVGNEVLVPLLGGCGSRLSPVCLGPDAEPGNEPTHGGGALQLVSQTRIAFAAGDNGNPGGAIDAGGARGRTCQFFQYDGIYSDALGGGSGGGILLEAPLVELASGSAIAANGGGGGCEGGGSGEDPDSEDGTLSDQPAAGQVCGDQLGGNGASSGAAAGPGDAGSVFSITAGGGGGVGRIRINSTEPIQQDGGAVVSPVPSIGSATVR